MAVPTNSDFIVMNKEKFLEVLRDSYATNDLSKLRNKVERGYCIIA
jgi:hypothetical protein